MKIKLSFSIILLGFITTSFAQSIPNAGFESWTSMGAYSNPDGWDQLNSYTSLAGVYTCEQGSPGTVGSYYLKLTSKTVTGVGVVPGVAVSGVIDVATQQAKSGFAFSSQPQALTGKWQHMIFGSSQGYIDVKLTKWNNANHTRIIVAQGHVDLTGMAMSWANFSIPLAYLETFAPDSCIISLSASGTNPTNNDYLWVDALAFTGNVTAMPSLNNGSKTVVFPNPSNNNLNIDLSDISLKQVQIKVLNLLGNEMLRLENIENNPKVSIDISSLSQGTYIVQVNTAKGQQSYQFIKN